MVGPVLLIFNLCNVIFVTCNIGPTSCVGKALALQEIRMVTCSLIQKFEFEFAPRFKPDEWENSLKDCFILVKGELPVHVKVRK